MRKIKKLSNIKYLIIFPLLINMIACSHTPVDDNSPPEVQFAEGERLLKKGRHLEAGERFRILKNRHPYSIYAALATLKIGDAQFEQEAYIESTSAYKVFLELYPKHTQADYALFRMGESSYRQVPDEIDRDLDSANSAITAFYRLEKEYPSSTHIAKAKELANELKNKLAEKEEYIGDFYFRHDDYTAAAGRYRGLLKEFPRGKKDERILFRLAESYQKIGEKEKSLEVLEKLHADFPQGEYHKDAKALETRLKK